MQFYNDPKCKNFKNECNGSALLKISLQLINKLKNKHDLKCVMLIYNSQKYCE